MNKGLAGVDLLSFTLRRRSKNYNRELSLSTLQSFVMVSAKLPSYFLPPASLSQATIVDSIGLPSF